MRFKLLAFLFLTTYYLLYTTNSYAVTNPFSVPNNKFGIHIISPTTKEASEAADLVNSSGGDWGYVTFLIESKNRDKNAWQIFFNDLRRRHLIPIVRLATKPVNAHWERPYEKEYEAWADFLNSLIWPTKNRYVVIYNEPNHGKEWGQVTDPVSYAQVLSNTIDALKQKSADFFVLNAGFDQSTPHEPPDFYDEGNFLAEMNTAVPGIFNKLDGWVSHSYPNPGFSGPPDDSGKGSIRGWFWELQILKKFGLTKNLPVFITETGWKHQEGINVDKSLPDTDTVGRYLKDAFQKAWSSNQIVAVTPFLLNYQETPFDHFSFKRPTGEKQNQKILGVQFPEYYLHYQAIADISKNAGHPVQENTASLEKGEIYSSLVANQEYSIALTFKNTGQSIWNEYGQVKLVKFVALQGETLEANRLNAESVEIPKDQRIEPGNDYTFDIKVKAPLSGKYKVSLNLFEGDRSFNSQPWQFSTEVKSPVILVIQATLKWKEKYAGPYLLKVAGAVGESIHNITLGFSGQSARLDSRYLLPGYTFDFTLEKPYYKPKTITQKVESGENTLNFGELEPELLLNLFNPSQLWQLLPFSN